MLSKILWSIVLHTNLLCAASYFNYFTKLEVHFDPTKLHVQGIKPFLEQQIERCAEKCFLEKYYCNTFFAYSRTGQSVECKTRPVRFPRKKIANEPKSIYPMAAIYTIKEPRKFDIVEEFSRNIESSTDWIHHIMKGYSQDLQSPVWEPILRGCWNSVVNGKPATLVDIIEENDTGERQTKKRKLSSHEAITLGHKLSGHSIDKEIGVGLKSWPGSSDFVDILVLAFLEIFSRNIGQQVYTYFDPIKKSLLIRGINYFLFIVSYGNGDYVMIQHFDGINQPIVYATHSSLGIQCESAVKMLKGTMSRLGLQLTFKLDTVFGLLKDDDRRAPSLAVIAWATKFLLWPLETHLDVFNQTPSYILKSLADMVSFVLSKVYGENIGSNIAQSRLWKSSLETHFTDIDIVTVPRSMIDTITVPRSDSWLGNET